MTTLDRGGGPLGKVVKWLSKVINADQMMVRCGEQRFSNTFCFVQITFIFCWTYVRLFQHHSLSEVSSTITSIFALFVTLLTSALIPVDVFLVSYMKHSNGTFKVSCLIIISILILSCLFTNVTVRPVKFCPTDFDGLLTKK